MAQFSAKLMVFPRRMDNVVMCPLRGQSCRVMLCYSFLFLHTRLRPLRADIQVTFTGEANLACAPDVREHKSEIMRNISCTCATR